MAVKLRNSALIFILCISFLTSFNLFAQEETSNKCEVLFFQQPKQLLLGVDAHVGVQHDPAKIDHILVNENLALPVRFHPPSTPGLPVLLFIGGLNSEIDTFEDVVHHMRNYGYGTIEIELRGQGSLMVQDEFRIRPIPLATQLHDIQKVMNYYKLSPAQIALVGYSYGAAPAGDLAFHFEHTTGEKFHSINLINPYIDNLEMSTSVGWLFGYIKSTWSLYPGAYKALQDYMANMTIANLEILTTQGFDARRVNSMRSLYQGLPHGHVTPKLRHILTRVNILSGIRDIVVPESAKEELYHSIPDRNRGIFDSVNASHMIVEKQPHLVIEFLLQALKPTQISGS